MNIGTIEKVWEIEPITEPATDPGVEPVSDPDEQPDRATQPLPATAFHPKGDTSLPI